MRIFPGDDEFMGCVAGYTRIVIVMSMQQTGCTELVISVPRNDTMMTMRAHSYILKSSRGRAGTMNRTTTVKLIFTNRLFWSSK